jgi:hypothetical protein
MIFLEILSFLWEKWFTFQNENFGMWQRHRYIGQWLRSLLGTFLPLTVGSHPRGRCLLRQTGGWLSRLSKVFRQAFVNQGPICRESTPWEWEELMREGVREAKSPPDPSPPHRRTRIQKGSLTPISLPPDRRRVDLSLFTRSCDPIRGAARCRPWGIHGEISTTHVAMAIPETLHNITRRSLFARGHGQHQAAEQRRSLGPHESGFPPPPC